MSVWGSTHNSEFRRPDLTEVVDGVTPALEVVPAVLHLQLTMVLAQIFTFTPSLPTQPILFDHKVYPPWLTCWRIEGLEKWMTRVSHQ